MSSLPEPYYTPEEYLKLERRAEHKSEYLFGHIYAMAGASPEHITINVNTASSLHTQLRGSSCRVYANDLRVKVPSREFYTYPDLAVICGELQSDELDAHTFVNPKVIIEILSPTTAAYDRGDKFIYYQQIQSLTDYVLIAQDRPRVEHFARQGNQEWLLHIVDSLEGSLQIDSISCSFPLSDIYEDIVFQGNPTP